MKMVRPISNTPRISDASRSCIGNVAVTAMLPAIFQAHDALNVPLIFIMRGGVQTRNTRTCFPRLCLPDEHCYYSFRLVSYGRRVVSVRNELPSRSKQLILRFQSQHRWTNVSCTAIKDDREETSKRKFCHFFMCSNRHISIENAHEVK